MILIEQDAKRLLMERLERVFEGSCGYAGCTEHRQHLRVAGTSELHYYLKVEHVFTPAEVEALLSFRTRWM